MPILHHAVGHDPGRVCQLPEMEPGGGPDRTVAVVKQWPGEGQVSRLKTIKRTMCGRAGFDLLRHRVLEAA